MNSIYCCNKLKISKRFLLKILQKFWQMFILNWWLSART